VLEPAPPPRPPDACPQKISVQRYTLKRKMTLGWVSMAKDTTLDGRGNWSPVAMKVKYK
jgi:hypothetical protein